MVELGTGLNTRFERTDNGTAHWIDLDLPDTIALRRQFSCCGQCWAGTGARGEGRSRRRTVSSSS